MTDSGAERAARIDEAINTEIRQIQRSFESLGTVNDVTAEKLLCSSFKRVAAIIREETGTQLEPNHHWKWFREYGQVNCPHKHEKWHKETPELCRPCDYARHATLDYIAALPPAPEGGATKGEGR